MGFLDRDFIGGLFCRGVGVGRWEVSGFLFFRLGVESRV